MWSVWNVEVQNKLISKQASRTCHAQTKLVIGRMDGWTDGRMDGWTDGRMDGWTDGRMDDVIQIRPSR
jgi:hypothetical protein